MDENVDVIGSLETFLANGDTQMMIETLKGIVAHYGKYMNI